MDTKGITRKDASLAPRKEKRYNGMNVKKGRQERERETAVESERVKTVLSQQSNDRSHIELLVTALCGVQR
eukprot:scaffold2798_cov160-Ochromonas_danica.AAC.33